MKRKEKERDRQIDGFSSIYIYLSRAGVKMWKRTFMSGTCLFLFSIHPAGSSVRHSCVKCFD